MAGVVAFLAHRGLLRFGRKVDNEVAIQGLPYVRHKPAAVRVQPPNRQFLGDRGHVRRGGFIDLQAHQVGGLGNEVWIGIDKLGAPRLFCSSSAKDDERRRGRSGPRRDLVTDAFETDALGRGLCLGHFGSPEKPKGPGEGPFFAEVGGYAVKVVEKFRMVFLLSFSGHRNKTAPKRHIAFCSNSILDILKSSNTTLLYVY